MLSSTPSTPIKDTEKDNKDQEVEHDYDFEAPKYYNFASELVMKSNDDQMIDLAAVSTCDDCTPISHHTSNHDIGIASSDAKDTPNVTGGLFEEDTQWFESNKYLVRTPDGKLILPIKPTRLADDPEFMATPVGRYCLQQSVMKRRLEDPQLNHSNLDTSSPGSRRRSTRSSMASLGGVEEEEEEYDDHFEKKLGTPASLKGERVLEGGDASEGEGDVFETRRITLDHMATPTKLWTDTSVGSQLIKVSDKKRTSKLPTPSKRSSISTDTRGNSQSTEAKDSTPQRRHSRNSSSRLSSRRDSEVHKDPSFASNTPKGFEVHSSVVEASMSMDTEESQTNQSVAHGAPPTGQDPQGFSVSEQVPSTINKYKDGGGWTATPLRHQSLGEITNNFGFKYPLQENILEDQTTSTKSSHEPVKEKSIPSIRRVSTVESIAKSPLVLHEPVHVNELCTKEEETLGQSIETGIPESAITKDVKDVRHSPTIHKIDALSEALGRLCRPLSRTVK